MSDSLWPHGLQHTKLPCPSLSPGVCSNSGPLSQWCHLTISFSVFPFSFCLPLFLPAIFHSIRVLSNELAPRIRCSKYWNFSFSISLSNQYSVLISVRIDWLNLLAVQETLKSVLQDHSSKASILWCPAFFMVELSHPYITIRKTKSESESCSVVSYSLRPHGHTVFGIPLRILEWVAFPFSGGSSQQRNRTQVSCTAGRFFTSWVTRKAQEYWSG